LASSMQDIRQHLLQVAAGRPAKRPRLCLTLPHQTGTADGQPAHRTPNDCTPAAAPAADQASTGAGAVVGVVCSSADSLVVNGQVSGSHSLGLAVLAPAVVQLVRQWLLNLVEQLVVPQLLRQDQQQQEG
jgi:hypothetical protein